MVQTYYDVPMVQQEANPICWIASVAMIESYWTSSSVGIGQFTDGFEPSQACIGNPAVDVVDFQNRLAAVGYYPVYPDGPVTLQAVAELSAQFGPLLYFHTVAGFPYSQGTGEGEGSHAIVITGTDTDAGGFWFNNPWGDKDSWADGSTGLATAADKGSTSFSLYFRAGS